MTAFAYRRGVAPMLWVLVSIAIVELVVVHGLVALWSGRVAILLSLASLWGIVWLVRAIRSFDALPVVIDADRVLLRTGRIKAIELPIAAIAGLRAHWDGAAVKDRSLLNLALVAYPNVVIDLNRPVRSSGLAARTVVAVAHRLDDPQGFAAALAAACARQRHGARPDPDFRQDDETTRRGA